MLRPLCLAGPLCLALAPLVLAVAPPPRPPAGAELQRLIDQLGHRDFRLREQADRQLHALGEAALPALRHGLTHRDPEVRRRVLRMLPGLEHAAIVAPKRFRLVITRQPLRTVLEQLGKATGYKLMAFNTPPPARGAAEPTFSYTFDNATFWDAIDRVCRDANLQVQHSYGDETVRLMPVAAPSPHIGREGAFRYVATQFQLYRSVDLSTLNPAGGAASRSDSLTFHFNLFAEPRLPFLGMGEVRLDAAYDNERNSMLIKTVLADGANSKLIGGIRRYYGGGHKQFNMQVGVNLQRVSEKATLMKELRGVVPVTLLVEQKPMVLTDKVLSAKGTRKTVGELEFHIEDVQKMPNNQFQVKFTITNKGNPGDYTWQNTLYQRLELFDGKGVKFQNWGSSWSGGGGNTVTLTLTYNGTVGPAKPGEPARFVYHHWVTRQHDVHFSFRDVPLP